MLGAAGLFVVSQLDGRHTAEQVRGATLRQFPGSDIGLAEIRRLLGELSKGCYLDDQVAAARIARVRAEFERAEVRPAWHAGTAYPQDPRELAAMLDRFFAAAPVQTAEAAVPADSTHQLAAVMCPHIDLRAGGETYPPAFRTLAAAAAGWPPVELYVILGVAHNGGTEPGKSFVIASDKHYATPLGQAPTDGRLIEEWSRRAGRDVTERQWLHRTEHSVEFPLLFLQYIQAQAELPRYTVVPVLLGGVDRYLQAGEDPLQAPEVAAELAALRAAVRARGKRTLYLLSVDLAHIGPKFGHPVRVDDAAAAACEQADRELLGYAEHFDAAGFTRALHAGSQRPQRGRRLRPVFALPAAGPAASAAAPCSATARTASPTPARWSATPAWPSTARQPVRNRYEEPVYRVRQGGIRRERDSALRVRPAGVSGDREHAHGGSGSQPGGGGRRARGTRRRATRRAAAQAQSVGRGVPSRPRSRVPRPGRPGGGKGP